MSTIKRRMSEVPFHLSRWFRDVFLRHLHGIVQRTCQDSLRAGSIQQTLVQRANGEVPQAAGGRDQDGGGRGTVQPGLRLRAGLAISGGRDDCRGEPEGCGYSLSGWFQHWHQWIMHMDDTLYQSTRRHVGSKVQHWFLLCLRFSAIIWIICY